MSTRFNRARRMIASTVVSAALTACATSGASTADDSAAGDAQNAGGEVVATFDGIPVTRDMIDNRLKEDWLASMAAKPDELYEMRRAGIDSLIDDKLVDRAAAGLGIGPEAYLDQQSAALGPVTDEEIDKFFTLNRDRIRSAESLEDLRPRIRELLVDNGPLRVVTRLREEAEIQVVMAKPPVVRVEIPGSGASRGPADAPVTIVEFSDYQCPYCRRAEETLRQVDAMYPGKLRFEYRHLPLSFHANAMPAAKAAICAGKQDRFWEYHDVLFKNQKALGDGQLRGYASQLDLDLKGFDACLAAPETRAQVERDMAIAKSIGASATPMFFVNGITLRGAQPAEAFRSIIDRELSAHAEAN